MIEGRPSLTAMAVSFARAVVTAERGAPGAGLDPMAVRLLPGVVKVVVEGIAVSSAVSPLPARAVRLLSCGVVDHLELRSLSIDAVTREALTGTAKQLVILGAGLDARAWRLPEVAKAQVFEVDYPATQEYKRRRAGATPYATEQLHFVAVDFARDSLEQRLAEAGHDAHVPTMWIWEGVTPYLPLEATRASLAMVAARSARGSTLAMTYATPEMSNLPAATKPFIRRAFAISGEPLLGLMTPDRMRAMVESVGMTVKDDSGMRDWIARFHPKHPVPIRLAERLAICIKA